MSFISKHLSFEKLAALAEDGPATGERAESLKHISGCGQCEKKLAGLSNLIALMREDTAEDAPRALIAGTIGLFRKRDKKVRRLSAILKFDSWQMSPAYGVRSTHAGARQILYSAGDYDVDLRIVPQDENWIISGQVFGEDCVGARIELESITGSAQSALNNQCEFTLPPVLSGSYNLRLYLSNAEVELPQLELVA
jgi:hypothetical protein